MLVTLFAWVQKENDKTDMNDVMRDMARAHNIIRHEYEQKAEWRIFMKKMAKYGILIRIRLDFIRSR